MALRLLPVSVVRTDRAPCRGLLLSLSMPDTLRGYHDSRFHDNDMEVFNAEVRCALFTHVDICQPSGSATRSSARRRSPVARLWYRLCPERTTTVERKQQGTNPGIRR